ncbi:MAG: riboflavin kinase, partial [Pseudomonadota bacterium]
MEIVRASHGSPPPPPASGLSVGVGNFDGVHRGHQAVLGAARAQAEASGLTFGALTFEPHPRAMFRPHDPPFRLSLEPLKLRRLEAFGVRRTIIAGFDTAFSQLTPEAFCRFIGEDLGVRRAVVGEDFCFGAGRAGDAATLAALGPRYGFEATALAPVGGEVAFSSSRARAALREGRPADAAFVLGEWHRIDGVVERGDQRGRELGFPTANQSLDGVLHPLFGVYATRAEVLDGPHRGVYDAVSSLGLRPTFHKTIPNFET